MDHADLVKKRHHHSVLVGDDVRNLQAPMNEPDPDLRKSLERAEAEAEAEAGREEAEVVRSPGVGSDRVGDKLEAPAAHGLGCIILAQRPEGIWLIEKSTSSGYKDH